MSHPREQIDVPPEWAKTFSRILDGAGTVMIVGAVDTGKSTLGRALLREARQRGLRAAMVDADVGQSSIGPPTTVGWAPAELLSDDGVWCGCSGFYFVGATSPYGHMLGCAVGARLMADEAAGCELIVVDTTGMVRGGPGAALKTAKADLLRPAHIIGLQWTDELQHILRPFEVRRGLSLHRLRPSKRVIPRDREERRRRRIEGYRRHFAGASGVTLSLQDVRLARTPLGAAARAPSHVTAFVEAKLGVSVLHAELTAAQCTLVVEGEVSDGLVAELREDLETDDVCIVAVDSLPGTVVALADSAGRGLCLGIIQSVDLRRGSLQVLAPPVEMTRCELVQFGSTRLAQADLTEIES